MTTALPLASRALVLIFSGLVGCGGDLLLPDPPGGGESVVLSKLDGDQQVGVVGELLQQPLRVQVMTARGLPVNGSEVQFVFTDAAGVVTPAQAVTNTEGEAFGNWVLGNVPGAQTVAARLVVGDAEPQTEEFTAEARPAAPATLSANSPTSQAGRRGQMVGTQPVVQVVDRFGNPVPEVQVAWQVNIGEGTVSEAFTRTNSEGKTTVDWTLGNRRGVQRVTATVGPIAGSPLSFTATVLF